MNEVVYDAGALIAADRNDREFWADHRVRLERGLIPTVPAPVVAQVSRSPREASLRRLLRGCDVTIFDEATAHRVGSVLARGSSSDIADGAVVDAAPADAVIVTSDRPDISRLLDAVGGAATVVDIWPWSTGGRGARSFSADERSQVAATSVNHTALPRSSCASPHWSVRAEPARGRDRIRRCSRPRSAGAAHYPGRTPRCAPCNRRG
nr:hypothetical protein [Sporichthya sp.]